MVAGSFDSAAARYDQLWTRSPIGEAQRNAVWRHIEPLFRPGMKILDLGCGTGEDALHLADRGVSVRGLDSSSEMVRVARSRGVDATQLAIENLVRLHGLYDGALSNFGALNCINGLASLSESLARLVRPGGHLALCTIGRFCAWETAWYTLHGKPAEASRRWNGHSSSKSLGIPVYYFSQKQIRRAFRGHFDLIAWHGIGVAVPPSFVTGIPATVTAALAAIDARVAHWPGLRALGDHRLAILVRR
jgi:SAM-dependent methyltransferase